MHAIILYDDSAGLSWAVLLSASETMRRRKFFCQRCCMYATFPPRKGDKVKESIRLQSQEPPVWYDLDGLLKLARAVREYVPGEKNRKKTAERKNRVDIRRNGVKTASEEHNASSWTTSSIRSVTNCR